MLPLFANFGGPSSAEARRAVRQLEPRQVMARGVLLQDRDRRACAGDESAMRILGRAGADQVLMIEERAAERPLEEMIREHVPARERDTMPSRCSRSAPCVRPPASDHAAIAVVLAAVDLHLVLEEPVHQIAGDRRGRERHAGLRGERMLDRERRVRQTRALACVTTGTYPGGGHAAPGRRQRRQHAAVAVALRDDRRAADGRRGRALRPDRRAPGKLPYRSSKARFSA